MITCIVVMCIEMGDNRSICLEILVSGQNYQVCRHSHPSTISQVIKYYESDIGFMSRK